MDGSGGWIVPYGITFPGKPAGRFSDGRCLTDYIASFFGQKSPVPFNQRSSAKKSKLQNGMNFAYGGSGVFNTFENFPNITVQIDHLQQTLREQMYTENDLHSSIALVSVGGNDYTAFYEKNIKDIRHWPAFAVSLIDQLVIDIKRIRDLGVRKIAVTTIEPQGCVPVSAAEFAYKSCNEKWNNVSMFHNQKLREAVEKLNNEADRSTVDIVDLYRAMMSVIKRHSGSSKFNPLKPCCEGITSNETCGMVDENGIKMYKICDNPKLSIFWDRVHPSQNGWHRIYSALKSSLHRLYI
ncbi:GDSL esterase/lipase At5g03610-like isoform X2 [Tripterygium wilfordii]|nr:GDSL esterase/lipase At5g03610-like isoform X2 [Tripterygium wilfordii]